MIVANVATFPGRVDTVEAAIRNIARQVDLVNLCLNEYASIPEWTKSIPNLNAVIPDADLKDLGKFLFKASPEDNVLLMDDDLAYPGDYARRSVELLESVRSHCRTDVVCGYHGTVYWRFSLQQALLDIALLRLRKSGRVARWKTLHDYHRALSAPRIVAQLGTGTVVLKGRDLPDLSDMRGGERRADVRFARLCHERGRQLVALPRASGWIPHGENDDASIYKSYTSRLPADLLEEIGSFAYRVPGRNRKLKLR